MKERGIFVGARHVPREILTDRSERLAKGMATLGLREGDVVAVLLRNRMAYLEIILACRRLGIYYCPVNWHFTAAELGYILGDSGARAVFTETAFVETVKEANTGMMPAFCVNTGPAMAAGVRDFDEWVDAQSRYAGPLAAPRGHMAYTSGTTGKPKGVVRDPVPIERLAATQAVMLEIVERTMGLKQGCRALLTAPLYHSAPSLFCQMSLQLCELFMVMERFDAEEFLRIVEEDRIEVAYLVPIMYVRLLKLPASVRDRFDLSSLRFISSTGAPCPPEIKARMIEWLGPVVYETYASSEVGMITLADSDQAMRKPGTAGKPVGPAEIRILDEKGDPLPPNGIGKVYVRQPAYADFTYKNNGAARRAVDVDGFIGLGDMGYVDEDGFLFICDRESDMVLSGGVNTYPAEIEHVLLRHPAIADCAVIGVPDPEYGESLRAFIDLEPGQRLDEEGAGQWLSRQLARYKIPRKFVFDCSVPRDLNGKISRKKLREQYWKEHGRKV